MKTKRTLGYDDVELKTSAYARFFDPQMAELPPHVLEALSKGAVAHELLPPFEQLGYLQSDGYSHLENGYTLAPDGSARIACLTEMPGVTPAMWEWWFAWHGSEALRYKLWHPLAHVDVGWADGRGDLEYYIGRTSNITEYQMPPKAIADLIDSPPIPYVSINPTHNWMLLQEYTNLISIHFDHRCDDFDASALFCGVRGMPIRRHPACLASPSNLSHE